MSLLSKTNRILLLIIISAALILVAANPVSAETPAGCPGGPAGPPSAGTVCPDGSVPVRDGSLPLGCPGSAQQGPLAADYTAECPARPGRSACTFSTSSGQCLTSDGFDVTSGDSSIGTTTDDPNDGVGYEGNCDVSGNQRLNQDNCGIIKYIVVFTKALSALVGIVIVIMIAVGGVQYAASRDDPTQVTAAKSKIQNAVMALFFYIFALAFLQWLVPGGVF